jgi:lipopolysaccharide transport system ATP-binding protein
MDFYNAMLADRENANVTQRVTESGKVQTISGTGEAPVREIALLNGKGDCVDLVDVASPVTLLVKVAVHFPIPRLVLGYMIKDRLGQAVFGTNTHHLKIPLLNLRSGDEITFRISFGVNLGPGSYSIAVALTSTDSHLVNNYEWRDLALVFHVANMSRPTFVGSAWLAPTVVVERDNNSALSIAKSQRPELNIERT